VSRQCPHHAIAAPISEIESGFRVCNSESKGDCETSLLKYESVNMFVGSPRRMLACLVHTRNLGVEQCRLLVFTRLPLASFTLQIPTIDLHL